MRNAVTQKITYNEEGERLESRGGRREAKTAKTQRTEKSARAGRGRLETRGKMTERCAKGIM